MKLYHVSYDPVSELIPRVPQHRMIAEDNTVRRICFSTSIEKCIEAKPGGNLPIYLMFENGFHPLLFVYEIDTDALPAECIIGPTVLHEQFGVDDAIENDEHWIIDTVIHPREIVREVLDVEWTSLDDPHINYLELTSDISDDCKYVHKFMSCMCEQSEEDYTTDTIIINMIEDIAPHLCKGIRKIHERRKNKCENIH